MVKFRRWKDARVAGRASASGAAPDRTVRAAEEIVRRAWACELLRRRDDLDLALQAAFEGCDTAMQRLAAAQRDGVPRKIRAARTGALRALEVARLARAARDEARRALRQELHSLTRRPRRRASAEVPVAGRRELRGPATATWSPSPENPPPGDELPVLPILPIAGPRRRLPATWLRHFSVRRAADPGQL